MKISGTALAKTILDDLKLQIQTSNLQPHLAIILATNNPAPKMYVSIKLRRAAEIGLRTTVLEFQPSEQTQATEAILAANNNQNYTLDTKHFSLAPTHGILVQLPMYDSWDQNAYVELVSPFKDVDGFLEDSQFKPATGLAVLEMLTEFARVENFPTLESFLLKKQITILGKGRTAGKPTADLLRERGFNPTIIDSKTANPNAILGESDIIISAVGKKNLITSDKIKAASYVIGIGVGKELHEGTERIYGDIDEDSIATKAKLYCPTIGGIGPLTIACLFRNVVHSCIISA